MNWELVAQNVGMFAAGSGILALLIRSVLGSLLKKDIEKFKHDLSKVAFEHQIRFENLHQKRADVIADLYGHIVESERAASSFLSPIEMNGAPTKEEKYNKAINSTIELFRYFDKNRIYLSDDLCEKVDKFVDELRGPIIDFSSYLDAPESNMNVMKEKREVWHESYTKVKEDIPIARKALEVEFRKIIGMSENA